MNEIENKWIEKIEFKNNNLPAINAENLNAIQDNINKGINALLKILYPIGKLELFFDEGDYSNYLGFKWSLVAIGESIVGVGTNKDKNGVNKTFKAGSNEGEYEHMQIFSELVEHQHKDLNIDTTKVKIAQFGAPAGNTLTVLAADGSSNTIVTGNVVRESRQQAMNVTNPTYGVYIWQRIE